jgi:hypothetical protein
MAVCVKEEIFLEGFCFNITILRITIEEIPEQMFKPVIDPKADYVYYEHIPESEGLEP